MDIHNLPMSVSRLCSGHLHGCCSQLDCGCGCHQVCTRCGEPCQGEYDASQIIGVPHLVCASCYVVVMNDVAHRRCEQCGSDAAYRELEIGLAYLCINCHRHNEIIRLTRWAS